MNPEKRSAHIYAYFLSRFDKQALACLGFKTDREAFDEGARRLGVLRNYIKFRRDEFDVEYTHRKGWHKRDMSPSISSVINTFRNTDFETMESIVRELLFPPSGEGQHAELEKVLSTVDENADQARKADYVPRGITGKKAEEAFAKWFSANNEYFGSPGQLTDRSNDGCGYDFLISTEEGRNIAIEVKALSHAGSGILLTPKEWETARHMGGDFMLALVSNLDDSPVVEFLANPHATLTPKRYVQKIVQINWTVSGSQLRKHRSNL